jgi:hypothetical protein
MKIPEKNEEDISSCFQKGYNITNYEDLRNGLMTALKYKNNQIYHLILNIFKRHQDTSDISDPKDQELFAMLIEQELKLKKLIK